MQQDSTIISDSLNPQQQKAVTHESGPLLVVSGAGSGKTRVITARIAHLMHHYNITPDAILALTFTNKAATEMKERIRRYTSATDQPLPFVGTFHSYCVRLLKRHQEQLPYAFCSILDEDDKRALLDQILKKTTLHKQMQARAISYLISHAKNRSATYDFAHLQSHAAQLPDIWRAYEREKQVSRCYDFDDLLAQTVRLLAQHETVRMQHQARVRHILVDEYQDTNGVQNELLKLCSIDADQQFSIDSLCAVGDEDQAIYSWRGATIENMHQFAQDFADNVTTIKIEQNYRSVQPILYSANTVIQCNRTRNEKQLWSDREAVDRVRCVTASSERHEAALIAQAIKQFLAKEQTTIGILYRSHYLSRALEEALIREAIPYTIVGGTEFYERKEVKDILAYAKLASNPFDRAAFLRCINCPTRGLGKKFVEQFLDVWDAHPDQHAFYVAQHLLDQQIITGTKAERLATFLALFTDSNPTQPAADFFQMIISAVQYNRYLQEQHPEQEATARIENLRELINAARYAQETHAGSLQIFLEEIALVQDRSHANDADEGPTILLMTLHAAKGLEFDAVIISGLEQGILPGYQALGESQAIEEERRLFYVGMTRARNYLLLTEAQQRYRFGTTQRQLSSTFLSELPTQYVQFHDLVELPLYQTKRHFHQWLSGVTPQRNETIQPPPNNPFATSSMRSSAQQQPTRSIQPAQATTWRPNQPVKHATFGIGIIKKVAPPQQGRTILTISFKQGTKQIESSFVRPV